ncbi:MAG: NAD(P)-binding domain-containing protein [Enterobacterales bacterium]|nr:NAD(P)-binding domain-containing protein [Enterobacterales bacterium]
MPSWLYAGLIYASPLTIIFLIYSFKRKRHHKVAEKHLSSSINDGLTEAASLHPIIDPVLCIGCGSCVTACPEYDVLGMIHRKAELINPANCIGHGACKTHCPQDAIKLVFGSATRGQEIPEVAPDYQTCIPGVFIAGELGGMGLIRNAIEQGRQAMDSVAKYVTSHSNKQSGVHDCLIVGAGPAGLSASLGAKSHNLNYLTIDQDSMGGTISHFPKGKLVMTQAATLPIVGPVKFGEIRKEPLMEFWVETIKKNQIDIQLNETLLGITQESGNIHRVKTSVGEYLTKSVILAIGRRGTPRQLGVPGEDQSKVVYRLADPDQYKGQRLLVVGGGDSALEGACSVAELNPATATGPMVTISYRKDSFGRAKVKNRERIDRLEQSGQLRVLYSSQVESISKNGVIIKLKDRKVKIPNQAIIVCAGGILPTGLLKEIGVKVETKYGTE